jgi:hypothetical protein
MIPPSDHTATPAGFNRNRRLVCIGINGWLRRNPQIVAYADRFARLTQARMDEG